MIPFALVKIFARAKSFQVVSRVCSVTIDLILPYSTKQTHSWHSGVTALFSLSISGIDSALVHG